MAMVNTYTAAVEAQTRAMLKIAQRLDERGYAVQVNGLNRDGDREYLFGYVAGGLDKFLVAWARAASAGLPRTQRRHPVLVRVHAAEAAAFDGQVFDHPISFSCSIPNRVRYRPINASLSLVSAEAQGHWGALKGAGILQALKGSEVIEYRGSTTHALEYLLRVLEMPHHRKILLGQPTTVGEG